MTEELAPAAEPVAPPTIRIDAVAGVFQQLESVARDLLIRTAAQLRDAVATGDALVSANGHLQARVGEIEAELALRDAEIERLQAMVPPVN
jgi:hypothetical protein